MFDLIVIGGGSGGVAAARRAASYNAKVLLVEKSALGGTCVNLGCVPKKLFVYASSLRKEFESSKNYGWDIEINNFDWHRLIENKNAEIKRLNNIYKNLLSDSSVQLVSGKAEFQNNNSIVVDGREYKGKKILIATGSKYRKMDIPGSEHVIYSDDVFYLNNLPKKIVIIGGGYIAVEFASIFNALGVDTTLLLRGRRILKEFDHKTVDFLQMQMQQKGIKFLFENKVKAVELKSDKKIVELVDGKKLEADLVLSAIGRVPNSNDLGLEKVGVKLGNENEIIVDSDLKTSVDNIYAVGDVTGKSSLTPVAVRDARAFADKNFNDRHYPISYDKIATTIFTQPNFASVGITEEEALEKSLEVDIFTASFRPMKNGFGGIDERAFIKIIVSKKNDIVEGLHIVSQDAGEIIQGFAAAIQANITKTQLDDTMAIHPTLAEEIVTMYKKTYNI